MTVNRTTIALTQGLQPPLLGPGVSSLVRPASGRSIALLVALLAILAMVAL